MKILSTNKTEVFYSWDEVYKLVAKDLASNQQKDCEVKDWHTSLGPSLGDSAGIIFECVFTERGEQ
jgi:hypothetical protein